MSNKIEETRRATVEPYIPANVTLPEITVKAVLLGAVLAAVLGGANAYLGLKVGLTVSASIPAAIVSMAILRFFRQHNILENNIVATAASSGEAIAGGVIFTLPALIILRYWTTFEYGETIAIATAGGVLGVLFTIPLRRALIIESDLKFPEGVATGEVLKAGSEGGEGVKTIAMAAIGAALLKFGQTGLKIFAGEATGSFTVGRSIFGVGSNLSVALIAVGYIVGLNIATLVFAGGVISWVFGIPIYTALYGPPVGADGAAIAGYDAAATVWGTKIRYMGVGAMVVGGVWALITLVKPIRDGVRSSLDAVRAARAGTEVDVPRTERDTPITWVIAATVLMALPIFYVFTRVLSTEGLNISGGLYWATILFSTLFALFAGFLFSSVAGYMAGLVGSSNSPISGVTIATILTTSLILLVLLGTQVDFGADLGKASTAAAVAIFVGAVVCCAAAMAGDNLQDLKAGQLVGATPWKLQVMQIVGVLAGALACAPVLRLLFEAYGLGGVFPRAGMDPGEMLAAPQATLMQSVARGVFARNLEWNMIGIGALIAVGIIALDQILKSRGSEFRTPVLAVAVGIYLPLELSVAIFLGGLVAYAAGRYLSGRRVQLGETEYREAVINSERRGLLFASGLITGEALVGILLAIPFAAAQSTDVLRVAPAGFETASVVLGIIAIICFLYWLYTVARRPR
ncbi:MAG TPA: oligopeptide transporter, OPT family [Pyrinomonadaceae bacterium]|nr:oligopeptide transporter, OPT family [Pyrinomonadaceae bacterium]